MQSQPRRRPARTITARLREKQTHALIHRRAAGLIRDRLTTLYPSERERFDAGYQRFEKQIAEALVGEQLASKYTPAEVVQLARLAEHARLVPFLEQQNQAEMLGGYLGQVERWRGTPVVADHDQWRYFANRFALTVIGHMEPKPGLPPTMHHLSQLVEKMKQRDVKIVIASPCFPQRHSEFLTTNTSAKPLTLAHQVGALPEADTYLALLEFNLGRIGAAIGP